jgi:hypothetical protein
MPIENLGLRPRLGQALVLITFAQNNKMFYATKSDNNHLPPTGKARWLVETVEISMGSEDSEPEKPAYE